ncbi:MAG: PorV/PorQ family protein [FCB group bacterium]|jgi:hypothetical protein
MQKFKVYLYISFFLVVNSASLFSETPFDFLRICESARSAALAGCFVAIPDDAAAVFFNPATIPTVSDKYFSTTFLKHVLDINSGLVTYVQPLKEHQTIAGTISYTNYGSFDYTNTNGDAIGTFGANNLSIGATYANELDSNLYYGVSGNFIFINLEKYNSLAFAVDAGLFYQIPGKRVNIGLSILHAGTQIKTLDGVKEDVPLDVRLGINHRLRGLPLLINFSFMHLADKTDHFFDKFLNFSIGGEFYLGKYIQARIGYNNYIRRYTSSEFDAGFSGMSGGIGVKTKAINIDYGAAWVGKSGILHRFSLNFDI